MNERNDAAPQSMSKTSIPQKLQGVPRRTVRMAEPHVGINMCNYTDITRGCGLKVTSHKFYFFQIVGMSYHVFSYFLNAVFVFYNVFLAIITNPFPL